MIIVLDESGTHAGSRAIAVAGFAIAEERIEALATEWTSTLREHGIEILHMRDFVPPHGRYSTKTPDERQNLFESLIRVIHEHAALGIGAAIEIDDFMNTTYKNALTKAPNLVDSPYEQCVRHCALQVAEWAAEVDVREAFSYFIERGCVGAGRVEKALRQLEGNEELGVPIRIAQVEFVAKSEFSITQCADFLAYEMYKELDRRISASPRATRASLIALVRENDRLATITSDALRRHLGRGAAFIEALVGYLPLMERFKVRCYGLRSLTDEQREAIFGAVPPFRKIWELCLATGEMGKRLDEVDPKLLPPDDPKLLLEHMEKTMYGSIVLKEAETVDGENDRKSPPHKT